MDIQKINIQKLKVNKGDTVVITLPANYELHAVKNFAKQLQEHMPEDTTVLLVKEGISVDVIPEELMNNVGWYRLDVSG